MATDNKYDRQLRLWGAAGQQALGETCVVLVRATAAGTETCKNLVLPGIGAIYVVDDCAYHCDNNNKEYASNFFLSSAAASSKSRAEQALEFLIELNPDVQGSFKHVDGGGGGLLNFDFSSAFANITNNGNNNNKIQKLLVVGSDLEPPLLEKVAAVCAENAIPFLSVISYGLIGIVRLQVGAPTPIFNPKPRDAPPDLRLVHPFPELVQLADSIIISGDDDANSSGFENHQHGHIPYPIILLKLQQQWKLTHENGKLPSSVTEKQEFQALVAATARNLDTELNFQEAQRNAYTAYAARALDRDHLAQLVTTTACSASSSDGSNSSSSSYVMHVLLQALQQFLQQHEQQPPVIGTIPDMTASTDWYVQLQTVYREKAAADLAAMQALVRNILAANNNSSTAISISDEVVATFCQNVFALDLLQTRSIADEYNNIMNNTMATAMDQEQEDICQDLAMATMEGDERPDQLPLLWYLGFRACQLFYQAHGRYPGTTADDDDDYANDVAPLQGFIQQMVEHYNLVDTQVVQNSLLSLDDDDDDKESSSLTSSNSATSGSKYAAELTRYANAEIHTIASIVGGVASQEAVKIITGQYVPLNNTYVYNGIASTGAVYKF